MAIEAIKNAGVAYQASSLSVTKEVSQPKEQAIQTQAESAALAEESIKIDAKGAEEQQGSNSNAQSGNENLKKTIEQINKKAANSEAVFGIHEETNRITIKIVDKKTKEVIKEFPPEKTLDMIAKAWELAGIMVDEKR
ncbi:MAG: flagellar protein FlaG [Lachnospiraceae bacterium]|nr:flagellar protein FlaG [Lachnospiraceae bacterium]MDY4616713.1 flagellar protein FlaG [Lachnospiraceae bacterium]